MAKAIDRKTSGADRRRQELQARQQRTIRLRTAGGAIVALAIVVGAIVVLNRGGNGADTASTAASAALATTGGDFHSLVADPTTSNRLFAGGHTSVSVSTDAGKTWREVDELADADAMGWAFADDAVYVSGHPGLNRSGDDADDAHLVAADAGTGPVESRDGGATWKPLGPQDPATWVTGTPDLDTIIASGPDGAVRSDDAGATWDELELPTGAKLVELAPDGTTLYTGVHRAPNVELHVSTDGGAPWS